MINNQKNQLPKFIKKLKSCKKITSKKKKNKKQKNTKESKTKKKKKSICALDKAYLVNQKKKEKNEEEEEEEEEATSRRKEKKSDEEQCGQSPCAKCATTHGHFRPKMMSNFSLQFSLHFREKTF